MSRDSRQTLKLRAAITEAETRFSSDVSRVSAHSSLAAGAAPVSAVVANEINALIPKSNLQS